MSFPVATPEQLAELAKHIEPPKKKVSTIVTETLKKVAQKTPGIMDGLIVLTISFWYFFFTGIAMLLGRNLPKEWLKIGTDLNRGRIARKISPEKAPIIKEEINPTFKVVDLDTHRPITVPAA